MLFPKSFFCDKPTRVLEMVRYMFVICPGKNEMSIEEYSFSQSTLEQVSSCIILINNIQF